MNYASKLPDDLKSEDVLHSYAWPFNSIFDYTSIDSFEWGKLIFFRDNQREICFHFSHERPSNDEILKRWGYRFKKRGC